LKNKIFNLLHGVSLTTVLEHTNFQNSKES
jgi:hypothetical protein